MSEEKKSILDCFETIGKRDKGRFMKAAEGYGITEEELLVLAVKAAGAGILPIKTKVIVELDLPEKE